MSDQQGKPEPSKTTVTSENKMSPEQLDAFLQQPLVARLGTIRKDGWPHVTPVWYSWVDGKLRIVLGEGRIHLKNLRRDPRATVCIDEDYRLDGDFGAGAKAVVIRATASITDDEQLLKEAHAASAAKYLGPDGEKSPEFSAAVVAERRFLIELTPDHVVTWDFT